MESYLEWYIGYYNSLDNNVNPAKSDEISFDALTQEDNVFVVEVGGHAHGYDSDHHVVLRSPLFQYYVNRLVRVMPVYLICFLEAIPITIAGYGSVDYHNSFIFTSSVIQSIIPTTTWTLFIFGNCLDGPGWTVCTLFFFWMVFPPLLRGYKAQSNDQLLHSIRLLYWIQLAIVIIGGPVISSVFGPAAGFWWTTGTPYGRLPVFMMGVCAGILVRRHSDLHILQHHHVGVNDNTSNSAQEQDMSWFKQSSWLILLCCGGCGGCEKGSSMTRNDFSLAADTQALFQMLLLSFLIFLSFLHIDALGNFWGQGVLVYSQLDLIVSLTVSRGTSTVSRILRSSVLQYLGRISMCIYLVHWPLIFYICWIHNKGRILHWNCEPNTSSSECHDAFNEARTMPVWGIPVVFMISIAFAHLLFVCVELPIRNRLQFSNQ